ncbi:MAG: SAM-dependent methyltransferase, partial [Gemmatimonadota bacterium]
VRQFVSPHAWDVWHDRAVLHFLTEDRDRAMYKASLLGALALDGGAVIATFGPKGPTRCSGLDVVRYDAERLQELLGPEMDLVTSKIETHITPAGVPQQFLFGRLERVA